MKRFSFVFALLLIFIPLSLFSQSETEENLVVMWTKQGPWKLSRIFESGSTLNADLVLQGGRNGQPHLGGITVYREYFRMSVEQLLDMLTDDAKEKYRKAKLTILEKNTLDPFPWIIFMIECKDYEGTGKARSIVMLLRKGWDFTFTQYVAFPLANVPGREKGRWLSAFRRSKIENVGWESSLRMSGLNPDTVKREESGP
jgi:hypothetical protein